MMTILHSATEATDVGLERDAELALQTLEEHIAIVSRNASLRARVIGRTVRSSYADALRASTSVTSRPMWRRFVSTLAHFVFELDRGARQPTLATIVARRALDRIVLENNDLLA